MNGKRFLLDTNSIVYLLRGNNSISKIIAQADWIGISIISKLEFLSFRGLLDSEKYLFEMFLNRVNVIDIQEKNNTLLEMIVGVRKKFKLKLPDAIILSTAIVEDCVLVTGDKEILKLADFSFIAVKED